MEDEHGLAQVVQHQRGQRETKPAHTDRARAKVTPIGVQGLSAGHREHHTAEHQVLGRAVIDHEPHRPARGQSLEYRGVFEYLGQAEHADHRE